MIKSSGVRKSARGYAAVVICAILAAAMLLSFASCALTDQNNGGNDGNDGNDGNGSSTADRADQTGGNQGDDNVGNNNSDSSDEPSGTDKESGGDGTVSGGDGNENEVKGSSYVEGEDGSITYKNEDIGASIELDDDEWVVASQTDLASLVGIVADGFDDETLSEQMRSADMYFDLYAQSDDGMSSVNIIYENLDAIYGLIMSEESYIDVALSSLEPSLESAGYTDLKIEKTTAVLAGEEHGAINVSGKVNGLDVYELLVCVKSGNCMITVTFATYAENHTQEMLEMFEW